MTRLAIDPITRIASGHLRIEAEVTDGAVTDAWSSGTMFRGMEPILRGRDARDAWLLAQRVCGACTGVHALASVRAVENALGLTIPKNARLVRNLISGSKYVQDHVASFYVHEALDWVDAASALRADPSATSTLAHSMSDWPDSSATYFQGVRDRLTAVMQSAQQGPFANGWWGHPAYRLPPELNLLVLAHYFEALDWQRQILRIRTILGGKSPHPQTYMVGGMALAPAWGGPNRPGHGEHPWQVERSSPTPLSPNGLSDIGDLITQSMPFVDQVFVPDVLAVAAYYPEWAGIGGGIGNYLSFGEFPQDNTSPPPLFLPRGRIMGRDLSSVVAVDQIGVAETVAHSWYEYFDGDGALVHPKDGQTRPHYAGPRPPFTTLDGSDKYSWLKAPRYEDDPVEVGPLARMLVAYVAGVGDVRAGVDRTVGQLSLGADGLYSTIGRVVARAIETQVVANRIGEWLKELVANLATGDLAVVDLTGWDPGDWPSEATGWGLVEGPRGAVGHWVTIRDRRIADYQIVDASTWNVSPRDGRGRRGACEQALIGTPVINQDRPLEILRTLHSFEPCLACAAH
jgi:Ni,Fe-hydrogenase I large subunit